MKRIRTKRGVIRRYNAIMRELHSPRNLGPHTAGLFDRSWDWRTLAIVKPMTYKKLNALKRLYRLLPA